LALASACAAGDEAAWERFVREFRPVLYRAADALDSTGRARELADALYAELYGIRERRESLFRYYQGRSSLATWLRAVLAQRYVDLIRADRRLDPLPDEEPLAVVTRDAAPDADRARLQEAFDGAFASALSALTARDRLRLGCYYAQELTLAETGRILGESEATSSRQLARTRTAIRQSVDAALRAAGMSDAEVAECYAAVTEDAGAMDLGRLLNGRKKSAPDRSV
jgi:RNA polymerase sigma factor (sigma-70 family)